MRWKYGNVGTTLLRVTLLSLSLWLWGCAEYSYQANKMMGYDCRPAVVQQAGSCVAMKGASK